MVHDTVFVLRDPAALNLRLHLRNYFQNTVSIRRELDFASSKVGKHKRLCVVD